MHSSHSQPSASYSFLRLKSMACSAALVLGLCTASVDAQWVVIDPANISQNLANFAKTVVQYGKDIAQYQAVLAHYQQQLIQLTHMEFTVPQMQNTYAEVPLTQGMDVACPGTGAVSGVINGLISMASSSLDLSKSIAQNQMDICQQIVMRQNDKFNQTVKMINRLQTHYAPNLQSLTSQISSVGTSEGAMSGAKGNVEVNTSALETEMRQWQGQIDADDRVIGMLQHTQTILATKAMQGSNTLLGNVVQAAAFQAAFSVQ